MICRVKCNCPNNHLIEVMMGHPEPGADTEVICRLLAKTLKCQMELWMHDGKLSDKCEVCQAPAEEFVFIADELNTEFNKETITRIMMEMQPELIKQRALRHARKNRN